LKTFQKQKSEKSGTEKKEEDEGFRLSSIWQQLKKLLLWLMKNDIVKGVELLKLCIIRRRNETLEEERRIMEQKDLMLEQVKQREDFKEKTILFEVCCNEDSRMSSHMRKRGSGAIRIGLPKHDMMKTATLEALKQLV
jgi:hypothetical protein